MENIIAVKNLGFDYGEGWVFHKLDLEIARGDFVAVIGANGAGKSTLLKMLAGVLEPSQGEICYYGQRLAAFRGWQRIGYVPQNPARQQRSFPISVEEVVLLGLVRPDRLLRRPDAADKARLAAVMEQFGLTELRGRRIGELSGGQQQRVFLARAMVKEPEILLLDEPATGIDTASKEELYGLLRQLNRRQGVTIVMVSHDLELAAASARSALCLDHGICFWGGVQEALQHHHRRGYFYR